MTLPYQHPLVYGVDLIDKKRKVEKEKNAQKNGVKLERIELLALELTPGLHVKTRLDKLNRF
jgi:hypothetical protein